MRKCKILLSVVTFIASMSLCVLPSSYGAISKRFYISSRNKSCAQTVMIYNLEKYSNTIRDERVNFVIQNLESQSEIFMVGFGMMRENMWPYCVEQYTCGELISRVFPVAFGDDEIALNVFAIYMGKTVSELKNIISISGRPICCNSFADLYEHVRCPRFFIPASTVGAHRTQINLWFDF